MLSLYNKNTCIECYKNQIKCYIFETLLRLFYTNRESCLPFSKKLVGHVRVKHDVVVKEIWLIANCLNWKRNNLMRNIARTHCKSHLQLKFKRFPDNRHYQKDITFLYKQNKLTKLEIDHIVGIMFVEHKLVWK